MMYRVVRPFQYADARGQRATAVPGTLVDIMQRNIVEGLLRQGKIEPRVLHRVAQRSPPAASAAPAEGRAKRVGVWLKTSVGYSGGRIHMFQYMWCLADSGADVYMMTNLRPLWAADYPQSARLHILDSGAPPPEDLDVVITDSKGEHGNAALDWKRRHPWVPFVCMNFETTNWIEKFLPGTRISTSRGSFLKADMLLANSGESRKYLLEWMRSDIPCKVLPPAVNTLAIRQMEQLAPPPPSGGRPYAVFAARGVAHKRRSLAEKAVKSIKGPFDLYIFSSSDAMPASTPQHRFHAFVNKPDVEKFALMRGAHFVLAPSLFEGFGMVPGEALASGTPVIVYDLPVLRQEYKGAKGIIYVPRGNEKKFVEVVKSMAARPKAAVDPAPVREKHGMAAMARRIERLPYHAVRRKSVTAQVVAYWGFAPEAVEAVYDEVDQVVIAFGPVTGAPRLDDGSLARIKALPDPDGKIKLEVRAAWENKEEMRGWCARAATGNYMMILDGDEVWTGFDEWLAADVAAGAPRWVNLWHDGAHWVHDAPGATDRWGRALKPHGSVCRHYRWSWWRPSYHFKVHHTPHDIKGRSVRGSGREAAAPGCVIYHLGHCVPRAVMDAKHEFYIARDAKDLIHGAEVKRREAWRDWGGGLGPCGDGVVAKVGWKLPEIVQRALAGVKRWKVEVRA